MKSKATRLTLGMRGGNTSWHCLAATIPRAIPFYCYWTRDELEPAWWKTKFNYYVNLAKVNPKDGEKGNKRINQIFLKVIA